ncbi:MAG: hypothetical protein A2Y71_06160 [Bacteroidetes bacterium RBG_13_42_15]|nr:MAG: hypothetical protein A2Y71_06160 [Bacteroidetes bacterium RBG_13_42_15]
MDRLDKEIMLIKDRTSKGCLEAVAYIRRDMDKTPPLIPVKTNNLRSSWFSTPVRDSADRFGVKFGFSANYAAFVHEMLDEVYGKKINWTRPGSGPKFFEKALDRNYNEILQIIADYADVK